jgi:hypothetical protein
MVPKSVGRRGDAQGVREILFKKNSEIPIKLHGYFEMMKCIIC